MAWKDRVPVLAAALWWGSLSAVGFLVVPLLFQHLGTPAEAGRMAARLFSAQTYVGLACGLLLLVSARSQDDPPTMAWAGGAILFVVLGLLAALLLEFGVAARISARQNLGLWHPIGSALYAAQWACALVVLWKVTSRRGSA